MDERFEEQVATRVVAELIPELELSAHEVVARARAGALTPSGRSPGLGADGLGLPTEWILLVVASLQLVVEHVKLLRVIKESRRKLEAAQGEAADARQSLATSRDELTAARAELAAAETRVQELEREVDVLATRRAAAYADPDPDAPRAPAPGLLQRAVEWVRRGRG